MTKSGEADERASEGRLRGPGCVNPTGAATTGAALLSSAKKRGVGAAPGLVRRKVSGSSPCTFDHSRRVLGALLDDSLDDDDGGEDDAITLPQPSSDAWLTNHPGPRSAVAGFRHSWGSSPHAG
jgi:hypothetical protein